MEYEGVENYWQFHTKVSDPKLHVASEVALNYSETGTWRYEKCDITKKGYAASTLHAKSTLFRCTNRELNWRPLDFHSGSQQVNRETRCWLQHLFLSFYPPHIRGLQCHFNLRPLSILLCAWQLSKQMAWFHPHFWKRKKTTIGAEHR